jgi:hypothetical protein
MNSKLEQRITSGRCSRPSGMFWYGPEGTRKTGAAISSRTLILDLERGSDQYAVDRIHINTYRDLIDSLELILLEKSKYEVIVVDPIEIAEKLLIGETCHQLKIDGLQGLPHGAAWQYLRENFDNQLMTRFNEIRRTGRHMVIIGHAQIRTVTLPGLSEPFDRYEPRLDKRNSDTVVEWADHVLFFDWDLRTAKNREGLVRAISSPEPVVRVIHGPGWLAKNRVGLTEPLKPEFSALAPLFGNDAERPGACAVGAVPTATAPSADSSTQPPAPPTPASRTISTEPESAESPLTDQEKQAAEAVLAALPQEQLLTFLRQRDLIGPEEDFYSLSRDYVRRILVDPAAFKQVVEFI